MGEVTMSAATGVNASSPAVLEFNRKVTARTARIGIVGLGYAGLPLSLMYSRQRIVVAGFDVDAAKLLQRRSMDKKRP